MSNSLFIVEKGYKLGIKALDDAGFKYREQEFGKHQNKEVRLELEGAVRGKELFIIKPTARDPNRTLMELLGFVHAARKASAGKIIAVIPAAGYVRSDSGMRSPHMTEMVLRMIRKAGVNSLVVADVHSEQYSSIAGIPVDDIKPRSVFAKDMKKRFGTNFSLSPLTYSGKFRTKGYKRILPEIGTVMVDINDNLTMGETAGKIIVLLNDIIDKAEKLIKAAEICFENGAEEVHGYATNPILSGNSIELIEDSCLSSLMVGDTLALPENINEKDSKIRVVSLAKILADILREMNYSGSVGKLNL